MFLHTLQSGNGIFSMQLLLYRSLYCFNCRNCNWWRAPGLFLYLRCNCLVVQQQEYIWYKSSDCRAWRWEWDTLIYVSVREKVLQCLDPSPTGKSIKKGLYSQHTSGQLVRPRVQLQNQIPILYLIGRLFHFCRTRDHCEIGSLRFPSLHNHVESSLAAQRLDGSSYISSQFEKKTDWK